MDLNEDGNLDILSGSYSRMEGSMAGLFQVLYGKSDKTFRKAEVLSGADGEPLIIPADEKEITKKICTRQFAVDWDGDGKLDLVSGNFAGTFYWFKGEGKGKFAPKPHAIETSSGDPLKIKGVHSDPFVVDWDGDGDLDLVSGSSDAGVYWAENAAGKGKTPTLKKFATIINPAAPRKSGKTLRETDIHAPTYATRVWVDDVNGDGKLDLLVGDSATLVSPTDGLSDEDFESKFADWEKAFQAASKKHNDAKDEVARKKAAKDYSTVYQQRSKFMKQEMTGFVWLYVQK